MLNKAALSVFRIPFSVGNKRDTNFQGDRSERFRAVIPSSYRSFTTEAKERAQTEEKSELNTELMKS
jgi:hypothetical protein